jgi:16S rRNA A1518/A1519 N6-dimethyltransferase RsmA/KsgA/DIM1 with predicted DNA glycosylase/AP lyase activity
MDIDFDKAQHFLIDKEIIDKEIKLADISKKDKIIEIGAGKGILTEKLAEKAEKVLAFEIDEKFKENLNKLKEENKNLEIIYEDALKHNWKGYNKIVSNIPYFIAGDLVLKSLEEGIEEIIIIVGENFKEILEEKQGKIGIIGNLFFNISYISQVNSQSFEPQPKVNSWLIRLKEKKLDKVDNILKKILCKNGKIKNAILYSLVEEGKTKNQAREFLSSLKLDTKTLDKPVKMITGKFIMRLKQKLQNSLN